MSNKNENYEFSEETTELVNEQTGEIIGTTSMVTISLDLLEQAERDFAQIKAGKFKKGIQEKPKYLEFTAIGQSAIGLYFGLAMVEITDGETKGRKKLLSAHWIGQDENGKKTIYNNGGVSLVDCFKLVPQGTYVEITYLGKKGKMKVYSVVPLTLTK